MKTFLKQEISQRGQRIWVLGVCNPIIWEDFHLVRQLSAPQPTTDCTSTNTNYTHTHNQKGSVITKEKELKAPSSHILKRDI